MSPHATRLIKAAVVVAVTICAVPVADVVARAALGGQAVDAGGSAAADEGMGLDVADLAAQDDAMAILDRMEQAALPRNEVPAAFVQEAGFPRGAHEERANEAQTVLGCVLDGDEQNAFEAVRETLGARGWVAVPLQGVAGATFVKADGALRWMLVTCSQVGDATSVVYRLDER